ncbi:zf-HC2 domain-containing protein [Moorellaceae bacterium AZ2]
MAPVHKARGWRPGDGGTVRRPAPGHKMQVANMNCEEARELFSLHLDNYLGPPEEAGLAGHLEGCPRCREELAGLEAALAGLRSLPGMNPAAPAGLVREIMSRVEALDGRRVRLAAWKRWAAAAAAVLALASGSLAYAARGLAPHGWLAALNPTSPLGQVVPWPGSSGRDHPALNNKTGPGDPGQTGPRAVPPVDPGTEAREGGEGTAPGREGDGGKAQVGEGKGGIPSAGEGKSAGEASPPGPAPSPTKVASNEPVSPVAFMNKERKINSTFLKVAAGDLDRAVKQAAEIGAGFNAACQVLAVQNTGTEQRAAVRFIVPSNAAPALADRLKQLGTVLDERRETEDITARFSAMLEQYRETVARANSARDEAERQQLLSQADFLEKQLAAWDKEAGEYIVFLWLEKS